MNPLVLIFKYFIIFVIYYDEHPLNKMCDKQLINSL